MSIKPIRCDAEAYDLFHNGTLLLARMHRNGIKISPEHYAEEKENIAADLENIEAEYIATEEGAWHKETFGDAFNINAKDQLEKLIFDHIGWTSEKKTGKGADALDKSVLEKMAMPFAKILMNYRKKAKLYSTYIRGILREEVDGFIHPYFSLNIPVTFRSSSSRPNFQNMPIRDEEQAKSIRSGFIPRRPNRYLGEFDFSGLEVRIGACYHKDPAWLKYLIDPTTDMHRDMAADCYKLSHEEVSKKIRYCGKNKFVFPQCYGDYYVNCAKALWESISLMKLETTSGIPLMRHLKGVGLGDYKKFENHIKRVEQHFWGVRFPAYAAWKDRHYETYCKRGYVDMYTGFRCQGLMSKNDVVNYVVQGAAFHCLLKTALLTQEWLDKRNMKSLIIGQIHDSMIMDIHPDELSIIPNKVRMIARETLPEIWPWITVPLDIEFEVAPQGEPWVKKKEWDFETNTWKKEKKK